MTRNQGLDPLDIGAYLCENVNSPRSAVNTSEGLTARTLVRSESNGYL